MIRHACLATLLLVGLSACAATADPPAPVAYRAISVTETPCFGFCPAYTITVTPDDRYVLEARSHTRTQGRTTGALDTGTRDWSDRLLELLYRSYPGTKGKVAFADISTPPGSVPTGAGLEVTDVEEDYWVLSKCVDGKLTPVPIDTLHSDKAPLRVTCTGKGSGLPFTPVEGAFYFGLDWPKQKEATVHEAAPQLGHFLLHHVPRGSRVLLCSFSAGCFWTLIADPAAELRVELEAKPIECRMCVPNAAAIENQI